MRLRTGQRVEGIRKTANGWAVIITESTACASHSGHPGQRKVAIGAEFSGPGAKARAIRAAGTNRVVEGSASALLAA